MRRFQNLGNQVARSGYNGVKTTGSIEIRFTFGQDDYGFELRLNN